jgi:glycosyltransferase involved in cell wall biosynthesis
VRILRVAQKLYPSVTGGGAYHAHAMSRDQAAAGHDVTVLTVTQDGETSGRERRDGYEIVRCPASVELLGNAISPAIARRLLVADDYDVVHAHSHLYFATNLAALACSVLNAPLAITNHGLYSQSAPEWVFDAYLRTVGRHTFDAADTVFCYSDTDRDRLRELGVQTDVTVVPNGIDVGRFTPEGPASELLGDGPTLLFVGRLTEGKRPADAIDALARVRDARPEVRLALAGDGALRDDLVARARDRGVTDAVDFLGHVAYGEMPALYRGADALVLPSRAEGMPRTVLEALATETPVVTSDLPQLRPLTGEAGHAVPVGDVAELAGAVGRLLDDPERAQALGSRGRELVEQRHSWASTVERTTKRLAALVD